MEHGSSLKKGNKTKLPRSSISRTSNSEWADTTASPFNKSHMSNFFLPMELLLPNLLSQHRFARTISIVVYLRALDKTNVAEIATGFEGVFPNCTGTICHREHANHSLQALFSQGWFTKIRCSQRSIYQSEQNWTLLLLYRQCLKN